MQTIMTSLCAFLSYHGVTISQTKTVYTSRSTIRLPLTARIFSRDSTPATIHHRTVDIEHHPANKVIKYLGGGLSLDLDWANIFASTDSAITMDLKRLANRRLTLQQTMLVANTVIRGRAGFFLQLAPFPRDMVKKWDVQLDRLLKLKGNLPYTSSPAVLHSPKSKGGIELFSFAAIAQASSVTGLLARLNNPTFVGAAARTRWHHMQSIINPYPSQAPSDSLTMHCCNRAKSIGYTIFQNKPVPECPGVDPLTSTNTPNTIANLRVVAATETMLSTILPLSDSDLLSTLESLGLHHLSQIATPNGSIRAWNEFSNRRKPAQWYERLANLPRFRIFPHPIQAQDLIKIQPPPLPSTDAPDYNLRLIRQRPDSAQRSFDSPPTPPTTLPQLIFFTDGSIKNRRGCPHGGHGSVTLYDVPGWAQSTVRIRRPGQPSYTLKVGRRLAAHLTLGDEPISVDTMELRTLLDIAENAPAIDIVVFVDPTYITKNLPNMRKLTTLRWTRFSNRHLWKRLIAAIDRREADGFTLKVIKCAAHDKDPTQHPHISLGNYVADLAAKEAASFCSPHTDWLPDDHTHFSLAFNNKLVRGDPRRHIRRTIASRSLHQLVTLPVEGASTQRALEGQLHAPTLADIRNPLKWAKSARQSIYPFALALQGRALSSTPSKTFRSRKNELAQHLTLVPTTPIPQAARPRSDSDPSDSDSASDWESRPKPTQRKRKPPHRSLNHRPLCPLCTKPTDLEGDHPDSWHLATTCPPLVSHRTTTRLECYGILRPLLTTHGTLVPHLHRWLRTVSQQPDAPLYHVPADIKIIQTFQLLDGFHIVNQDQLMGNELPKNTSTIIHFPANRFPVAPHDPAWIPRKPSALLLFKGPNPLPEVSELQVRALADMLRCRLWLGAHGLLLRWGNTAWALDRAPSRYEDEVDNTLNHFGLLPLHNPRPPAGDTDWHPSQSWLGHMPPNSLHPGLPAPLLKSVYTALTASILIGQEDTYRTYKRLVAQELHFRKRSSQWRTPTKAQDPIHSLRPNKGHLAPVSALLQPCTAVSNHAWRGWHTPTN